MKFILIAIGLLSFCFCLADPEVVEAVHAVQKQMKSSDFQKVTPNDSKEAKLVKTRVSEISGSAANEQEIYELASEVLGNMKDNSPEEMLKILSEAQTNPAAFAERWTPEQKKKLKELAERLPASQKKKP